MGARLVPRRSLCPVPEAGRLPPKLGPGSGKHRSGAAHRTVGGGD